MLIILNGVETLQRKWFGEQISSALNRFVIDGYRVDYTDKSNFKIFDDAGSEVARQALFFTADGKDNHEGKATFQKMVDFQWTVFTKTHLSCKNRFVNIAHDMGQVAGEIQYTVTETLPVLEYLDVVHAYRERPYEYFVITGSFAKGFVNTISTDLGADNVQVYNIVRNPSSMFMVHEKSDYFYLTHPEYTSEINHEFFIKSLITAGILSQVPRVVTYKFEDIMRDKVIVINGVEVSVPSDLLPMHNEWVTKWEYDNIIEPGYRPSEENLNHINGSLSDISSVRPDEPWMYSDFFALLGYTPLDYATLTS